jgi:hypothetical protein
MIAPLAAAIPKRGRWTFTELLIGAAVTISGHITDAIIAAGHTRRWISYYWFVERARWSWLALWAALLGLLKQRFSPPLWHIIIDDTVVERCSTKRLSADDISIIALNPTAPVSFRVRGGFAWLRFWSAAARLAPFL